MREIIEKSFTSFFFHKFRLPEFLLGLNLVLIAFFRHPQHNDSLRKRAPILIIASVRRLYVHVSASEMVAAEILYKITELKLNKPRVTDSLAKEN